MIDYILGVPDPQQWHAQNLNLNRHHYASWMVHLGGARLITEVADDIGVGVHFNPYVSHKDRMFKYGVVRMHDLVQDILGWDRFYLSGRLQKPEELYAKICSLSYMGDLRMLFAEDKNKVKKIVQGQFKLFQTMYRPILEEFAARDCFRLSSSVDQKVNIIQAGLWIVYRLLPCVSLPLPLRNQMGIKLGEKKVFDESGRAVRKVVIKSKEEAADCMRKIVRQKVMVSSARQAVAGLLTVGVVHGLRYVGSKMHKAWKSWW
ncbi:UNVERIFIED_CONTAM: Phosphatidate cytidylyltransferase, mitochondrial [Sesamum angustifolium]|uniref:Phosphatidate cytidylyltransferase, mitochondrial n=1 Tax=Sesamum angustifolium TaxID=2727405 RepID=A0AAW2PDK3_9LAMI